jgi:hypothetical protein
LAEVVGPIAGGGAGAALEHDGGAAGTATFQIQPAAAADVDKAGEITLHGHCSCWCSLPAAEEGDGADQDGECQSCECVAKV